MNAGNVEVHSEIGIGFTKQTEKKGLTMGKKEGKLLPNNGQGTGNPVLAGGGKGGTCIGTPKTNTGKGGKKSGC